ncbi:uncharacterized protein LOC135501476 isoform X2 [Lineus longissimus]|uniref:uncharacterized protein LOC135501476 isoform X2 n=1 Tax=Lineus longissimus TaxID=88925 RepID=UPI00315DF071
MDKGMSQKSYQHNKDRSHQEVFDPLMLQKETCASQEHDEITIECDAASKEIMIVCDAEETIEGNVKDESAAIPQPPQQTLQSSPGRKSNRRPKQPRSYSPSLLADGQKASKRRKKTSVKRRETERLYDKLSDGSPFCCDLCGSAYVCKPSRKSRSGKVSRHTPYPRFGIDPNTGKKLMMCNACGLAFNRPKKKKIRFKACQDPSVDHCEKEKYLKDAKEFGESLAQQLNEPLADRLYCPKFVKKACGCIQTYIMGMNSGNYDSSSKRALELLELLTAAKELASLKFYDTGVAIPKVKNRRGTIGLGCGQRRSKIFEAFVLEERRKLKEGEKLCDGFCLCELACQRLLCYSNNFLHKKLKTVEGVKRLTRTKGKLEMGLLKPIHELPKEWCCGDRCSRMAISHGKLLQRWRSQAKEGQANARRVLAEMLTPAGGARPNCYRFIAMVTGCSPSTISRVSEQMRETGGDREPPVHGMKKYWKNKPKKPKEGKKVKPSVYTELNIPSSSVQNQLHQNQILHHAAVTKDGKKIITHERSLLKKMLNKVNMGGLVDVPSTEIHCETNVDRSIVEPIQVIPSQTSLAGQQDQSITIQLAPTYAQTMEHYQVLVQNSNHDSIQFANASRPLNLSPHTQSEMVTGDGLQNPVLGNDQKVFSVPLGEAFTSLAGDALVTGEALPRYSDVVSLKKRASKGARNASQNSNEKKQDGEEVPLLSPVPIVSSSGLPTGGDTVPVTNVLGVPLSDTQTTRIENNSNSTQNSDTDAEMIRAKVNEKVATSGSVKLMTPNVASEKDTLSAKARKKQPVSLLPSMTAQPQVLQCQYQQSSVPYGNGIHYASPQPGSFQLILRTICLQPQGQIIQVLSPLSGPTVVGVKSEGATQVETNKTLDLTPVHSLVTNKLCSPLQEKGVIAKSATSDVRYVQLAPPGSTDQAVTGTNVTSDENNVDLELVEEDTGERWYESNRDESQTVVKDASKENAPVMTGLLPKAARTGSLRLSPDHLEKDSLERRNDPNNDESPAATNISSKVNNSLLGQLLSQPPVSSSVDIKSSPGKGPILKNVATKDGAPVSGEFALTKKTTGNQERGLISTAKSSEPSNNVFVVPNPSLVTSPMKPNFIQVPVSPPSGCGVQLMTVPVCSGLMKFAPARYQAVNSNARIVSAPPMNLARNIQVVGNANSTCTQFLMPDGKLQTLPQQTGTVVVPAPGTVQMTSVGGALPLSYVQATSSQLMSPGNRNVRMVSLGSLPRANGGVQFLNPNFQPIPRSPPPKYRCPLKSTEGVLIKKDFKNLAPKPSVTSCNSQIILQPIPLTVMREPVGQAVTMVTTASSEKPTTN